MSARTFVFSLLSTAALGSVIGERTTSTCKTKTEGFDEPLSLLGQLAGAIFGQVGTGDNGDLNFRGASKINWDDVLIPNVNPVSRPNTALIGIFGATFDYLTDRLFNTRVGLPPLNYNTTITPAGKYKSFDLKSMYVACGGTASQVASLSADCLITVTGTDINGNAVSSEDIEFGSDQLYNSTMQLKKFEGFTNMKSVGIRVLNTNPAAAATVLLLDDVEYCVHT